jgi:hypothetical protein
LFNNTASGPLLYQINEESIGFEIHKAIDFETTAFSWYAEGFFTCLDCREQHVP